MKVDKNKQNNANSTKKVDKVKISKDHEDYGYDFVPTLDEWVNIDEQREKVKELEDISYLKQRLCSMYKYNVKGVK